MKIDGHCHCGRITYEAEIDPERVEICHCTDCQTLSGSAFRTIVATPEGQFHLLTGAPKTYVKRAESGNQRIQAFCPDCGTSLYSTSVGEGPKNVVIRIGTITQRDQLPPKVQYWVRSAQSWAMALDALPKVEKE